MPEHLTTDDVESRDRISYWREMICAVYVDLDSEPLGSESFSGSVSFSSWGPTQLSTVESDAQVVRRRPGSPDSDCLLSLQLSGNARITQFGRTAHLDPGQCSLYDASAPYQLSFDDHFSQLVLQFPREELVSRNVHIESTVARTCSTQRGVGAIAASFVQTLAANDEQVPEQHRSRLGGQALDFMATALAGVTGSAATVEAVRDSDRRRVLEYVGQNLHDPELSVSRIASAFGVSTRTIQKLFADNQTHLGKRIRAARIERAKTLLSDPLRNHHTIARISYDLGFSSPSLFSRVFKASCGCSPSEFRNASAN